MCRTTGWTFEEFDGTDARGLFLGIQYDAVRTEQQKAISNAGDDIDDDA